MKQEVRVVTKSNLNIRSAAGTTNPVVGSLSPGSIVIVIGIVDIGNQTWYKLEDGRGWVCGYNPGGGGSGIYLELIRDLEAPVPQPSPTPTDSSTTTDSTNDTEDSLGLDETIITMLYNQQANISKKISASTRLFGCPFQFIKQTDFRINDNGLDLGRKYLENIIAESPIVFFTPGRPNYLPNVSQTQKDALNSFFTKMQTDESSKSLLNDITNSTDVRYFDFINDFAEYMRYVNLLCRMCAIYLGIENKKAFGTNTTYKYYDWTDYKYKTGYVSKNKEGSNKSVFSLEVTDDVKELFFGNFNYIQFYVEPNTSFSESMGANTTSSKLQSMFETGEGLMKELSFLTNTAALSGVDEATKSFGVNMEEISKKMINNNGEGFFSRLLGMSSAVLKGSNILFPELWQDSHYNKSYNVTINLVSPYGDKESLYLNILVPLMHILTLGLPRQSTANSFAHPFLVKAFSKGWFSCEMGIIDSIQIDKGGSGDAWTVDGLPSEMKITIGVKDLYSNLMITPTTKPALFFENQGMIDFLAVMCGIDLTKPNFLIKLESMFSVFFGKVVNLPKEAFNDVIQSLREKILPLFRI